MTQVLQSSGPAGIASNPRTFYRRADSAPPALQALTGPILAKGEIAERCICCLTALRIPEGAEDHLLEMVSSLTRAKAVRLFRCSACTTVNELRPRTEETEPETLPNIPALRTSEVNAWEAGIPKHRYWPKDIEPSATLEFRIHQIFSSLECLDRSFTAPSSSDEPLDIDAIKRFYALVRSDQDRRALLDGIKSMVFRPGFVIRTQQQDVPWRWAVIVLLCPLLIFRCPQMASDDRKDLLVRIFALVANTLHSTQHHHVVRVWTRNVSTCLPSLVGASNSLLSSHLQAARAGPDLAYTQDWRLCATVKMLSLCYVSNRRASERGYDDTMPTSTFYNVAIDSLGYNNIVQDFELFKRKPRLKSETGPAPFIFCQYPFLLSMGCKLALLSYESRRAMAKSAKSALRSTMAGVVESPTLTFKIRRTHVVRDSLQQLFANRNFLKKPLKISFVGEEGIDAGGLLKEWLLLLSTELFSPKFGMFLYDDESNLCWFNELSPEADAEFYLIGACIGLAVYSSSPIEIPLPVAAYKMLVKATPTFADLKILHPELARGLEHLLAFEGDVEETFCRSFTIERESCGRMKTVELKEGGKDIPVTAENRKEYVDLLTQHTFAAAASQFAAFARGFHQVVGGNALSLFSATELELLVRGQEPSALDINQLRACATADGFRGDDAAVDLFWEYMGELSPEKQRKVLEFICGSGRLPATGVLRLRFTSGGKPSKRLPTSHTCFNQLVLPRYTTKSSLATAMQTATEESAGFGLR